MWYGPFCRGLRCALFLCIGLRCSLVPWYRFCTSTVLVRSFFVHPMYYSVPSTQLFCLRCLYCCYFGLFFISTAVAAVAGTGRRRRVFSFTFFFQIMRIQGGVAAAVCPSGRQGGAQSAGAGLRGRLQGGSSPISCVLPCPPPRPYNTNATYRAVVNRTVSWLTISRPTKYYYGGGIVSHSITYHSVPNYRERFD